MTTISVHITTAAVMPPNEPRVWEVAGDEALEDWSYQSRTLSILDEWGNPKFVQLPSVMRFDKQPVPNDNDWRVDETWLKADYIRINNYDGDGLRRCENYLWNDHNALYNNQGFPRRQYLTMSRNVLQEIEWVTTLTGRYLKFKTLRPGNSAAGMTHDTHPQYVHRFDLIGHKDGMTYHTYQTPRGYVYFFLTSLEGFGWLPERYIRRIE